MILSDPTLLTPIADPAPVYCDRCSQRSGFRVYHAGDCPQAREDAVIRDARELLESRGYTVMPPSRDESI